MVGEEEMKKILVVATWILGTTLSGFAQDADPAAGPLDNTIPDQLAKIVGSGAWFYMWPHGHLPLEPDGYALKSAPVDFTMPHGGRS